MMGWEREESGWRRGGGGDERVRVMRDEERIMVPTEKSDTESEQIIYLVNQPSISFYYQNCNNMLKRTRDS